MPDAPLAGMEAGTFMKVTHSRTNYDESIHGVPEWLDVPPEEDPVEIEDCLEDLVPPEGVEQQDLNAVLNRWGDPACDSGGDAHPCPEDLASPDGVEQQDLNAVLNRWGDPACDPTPPAPLRGTYSKGNVKK